ncbi:MAG: succinyl-diaminopimelate desuccinylase [Alphaproteobacteria bacterium]
MNDPVELTARLVACPSVTPADAGAQKVLEKALSASGAKLTPLTFEAPGTDPVRNLFARVGVGRPHFAFAGHTDVVPTGDDASWDHPPFSGAIADGRVYGRGATDMKGGVACFAAALNRFVERHGTPPGTISMIITGDEEGPAINGTLPLMEWLREEDLIPDHCLVGEPTNPDHPGQMIKIGRRGSLSGHIEVQGTQGHVAYPDRVDNPAHRLVRLLSALTEQPWDDGSEHFQPTSIQVTTIDIGNPALNVVPEKARASFNLRFSDQYSGETLEAEIRSRLAAADAEANYRLQLNCSAESFLSPPSDFSETVAHAVEAATGRRPVYGTTGGTSDARFIRLFCPVAEYGAVGKTMHQVNEHAEIAHLTQLSDIYLDILERYFGLTS